MKTVLIIDDDEDFRTLMGEILQLEKWQVLHAREAEEGIQLARTHRPDVVVCDLVMANGNGFQVCRALRGDERLQETKIIVSSGKDSESARKQAFEAGAHQYLAKPYQPNELVRVISRISPAVPAAGRARPASPTASGASAWLKFWGVRGSIATPGPTTVGYGGNTSCVEVRADGQHIILDAGTGMRLLGRELLEEFGDRAIDLTLLLTHTHWDHIQGLPFFLPVYEPQNRLRILGYEGARHGLENVLTGQMESPFFPIALPEVPANVRIEELKESAFKVGNVRVEACLANHPGICVGYRLFTSAGSIAFFPDNEPYRAPADADQLARETSRKEHHKLVDFLRGVDVLMMDTQYDREEYLEHVGWGHGCLNDVVELALEAEVKRLFLFHHDPDHDDAKISQMVDLARQLVVQLKGTLEIEAAREGVKVEMPLKALKPRSG